jgi:hypothetical protein
MIDTSSASWKMELHAPKPRRVFAISGLISAAAASAPEQLAETWWMTYSSHALSSTRKLGAFQKYRDTAKAEIVTPNESASDSETETEPEEEYGHDLDDGNYK